MPHVMEAIAARIAGARLIRFDAAGHMGPLTHSGLVAQAMARSPTS